MSKLSNEEKIKAIDTILEWFNKELWPKLTPGQKLDFMLFIKDILARGLERCHTTEKDVQDAENRS